MAQIGPQHHKKNGVNGCRSATKGVTALLSELFFPILKQGI
jgi:hypothetical protein